MTAQLDHCQVNGHADRRLPIANVSFAVEGEGLMMAMKDIAASSGSAYASLGAKLRAQGAGRG